MPRPLIDSPYIFAIHEPGGEQHMLAASRPGWIVFTEALGHDPEDHSGVDYTAYSERGLGIIARLNHGYEPDGTLPHSSLYESFARRVANFVGTSRGCKTWVIGNEMNYAIERPGVKVDWSRHRSVREGPPEAADPMRRGLAIRFTAQPDLSREIRTTRGALISPGEVITPDMYARCYRLCRDAIHRLPGHADDLVLVGPVAPWNTQTIYPGNPNGDWVQYFQDILAVLGPDNCDGFALHAYTHGDDPSLIASPAKLAPPFQARHQHFRVYTDFLNAVPPPMRHLPAFLTEVGQAEPWGDENNGWVQALYAELDAWNQQPGVQQVRAAALYRWPRLDRWHIAGKQGIEEDFRLALAHDYRWQGLVPEVYADEADGEADGEAEAAPASPAQPAEPPPAVAGEPAPARSKGRNRATAKGGGKAGAKGVTPKPAASAQPGGPAAASQPSAAATAAASAAASAPQAAPASGATPSIPAAPAPAQPTAPARSVDVLAANALAGGGDAAARPRRRRERTLAPPPVYGIEWLGEHFPARLYAGQVIAASITLKNTGTKTWPWGGGNPVRLGYRYYRNRRPLPLAPTKDLRTDVPEDVAPGQTVIIDAHIALPDEPGNYTLELDLVQEGVTWFKDQGVQTVTRWLTVEAASSGPAGDGRSSIQLPVRLFTDISTRLPRSGAPYARRNLNQIKYIVVSHTGVHPQLGLDRIAAAHIKRGYPGIAYDFMVDTAGNILKVKELEDVAQPDQPWSEQGVNICLTGNFSQASPPLPQLDAAGRLCAWLAQNIGLTATDIVGLGELIASDSPGESFYRGAAWKDVLKRQVRLHLAALGMGATDSTQLLALETQIAELSECNETLRKQKDDAEAQRATLQQQLEKLQGELRDLKLQMDAQPTVVEGGLRLNVIIDKLPRDKWRYAPRPPESVAMIIVNHTGVPPETPLQEIAVAHRTDWPGLLYDFVVDAQGEVLQTQPLDQVADAAEPFVRHAINIAIAGDFTRGREPSSLQIAAAGRLVAWLRQRFPNVGVDDVRGLRECTQSISPGDEWDTGRAWKLRLLAAAGIAQPAKLPAALELELRGRIERLERDREALERERDAAEAQRLEAAAEREELRTALAAQSNAGSSFVVPKPPLRVIVDQLPKHPTLRYERRALNQITHLAIHHTAAPPRVGPARIAELHVAADAARGKEPWPGIGYHFFVHEDGTIEQTNWLETASFHLYRHYGYTVGVVFAGSFMNGKIPSSAQLRSGGHLVAWLMQELRIPLARVWGHREFPDNATVCPGGEWTQGNRWRDLLFERIEQIQQGTGLKTVRHYLLFGARSQAAQAGREDMVNALAYIARFHPTVGYSPEEARAAEYVTIVGGEASVGSEVQQMLAQAGCKVERLGGRDSTETGLLFAELVRAGRRFRTFESDF